MPKQLRDIVEETPKSYNPDYTSEGDQKFIDLHKIETVIEPEAEPGQFSGEIQNKKKVSDAAGERHGHKDGSDKAAYKKANEEAVDEANNVDQLKAKIVVHKQGAQHMGKLRSFMKYIGYNESDPSSKEKFKQIDRKVDLHSKAYEIAHRLINKKQKDKA